MTKQHMNALALSALLALSHAAAPTAAHAQQRGEAEEYLEPSPAQLETNNEGFEAVKEKDYERAVTLFQASIELGELNITYYNLGRSLHHLGRCREARDAYTRALTAPRVRNPPHAAIEGKVRVYLAELARECPGELVLSCAPADLEIVIDDAPPAPCSTEPIELSRGEHLVRARRGDEVVEKRVLIEPMERQALALSLASAPLPTPGPGDPGTTGPGLGASGEVGGDEDDTLAWALLGAGGAAILAGGVLDFLAWQDVSDDQATLEDDPLRVAVLPVGLYVVGATLAIWGLTQF